MKERMADGEREEVKKEDRQTGRWKKEDRQGEREKVKREHGWGGEKEGGQTGKEGGGQSEKREEDRQ